MAITLDGSLGITSPLETVVGQFSSASTMGFKNRIINGACVIDQRNAGASVTITSSGTYTLDRWVFTTSAASKISAQQNAGSVTPPVGFSNYMGVTSLSAYSILSTDYFFLTQKIEGFNTYDLGFGTVNAKTVTLSFQVYSSLTGTFGGSIQNSASNRCYPFSYTVSVANTWTPVSITIAGDTTGTWIGSTNGIGMQVNFGLGIGSANSATAGAWGTSGYTATGATSVVGTSGATFYITGVQLEKGSTATSFDYRPYGTELSLCQRYYQLNTSAVGYSNSTTAVDVILSGSVQMRVSPSVSLFNGTSGVLDYNVSFRNISVTTIGTTQTNNGIEVSLTVAATTISKSQGVAPNCVALTAEL